MQKRHVEPHLAITVGRRAIFEPVSGAAARTKLLVVVTTPAPRRVGIVAAAAEALCGAVLAVRSVAVGLTAASAHAIATGRGLVPMKTMSLLHMARVSAISRHAEAALLARLWWREPRGGVVSCGNRSGSGAE